MSPLSKSRLRKPVALATLLLLVMFLLLIEPSATVLPQARPSAQDIKAARELWAQMKLAQNTGAIKQVRFDKDTVSGLSALSSDASGIQRVEARLESGVLSGSASIPLPLGFWMNIKASVTGHHDGFPAYHLKVGRITFPDFTSRWFANLGRWGLNWSGAQVPPLDELVRQFRVEEHRVIAEIALPRDTGVFDSMMSLGAEGAGEQLVRDVYCQAVFEQRTDPVDDLHLLVNRVFAKAPSQEADEYNRAAFVALSLLLVEGKAQALVPNAEILVQNCPRPVRPVYLHGREDLAKHWVFSAALTSAIGERVAANLGEWKELNDSLQGGSGFSFVDLAADRAGMRIALLSLDPSTADFTSRQLSAAGEDDLLQPSLLKAPEALSEQSFEDRFGSLQETRYREAVAHIDGILAGERSLEQRND